MTLKTVTVDGIPVEVTDQGAAVIATLQQRLADSASRLSTAEAAHTTAIAAKDNELAKKDAEIDDLKGKQITDAQIDARVKARGDLIAKAKTIADGDYAGKSDSEIRKAVVIAKLGDAAVAGKAEAYVDARFDILAEDAAKDPVRQHLLNQDSRPSPSDNGQSAYESRLNDAWKGGAK